MARTTRDYDVFRERPAVSLMGVAVALFLSSAMWAAIIGTYNSIV